MKQHLERPLLPQSPLSLPALQSQDLLLEEESDADIYSLKHLLKKGRIGHAWTIWDN